MTFAITESTMQCIHAVTQLAGTNRPNARVGIARAWTLDWNAMQKYSYCIAAYIAFLIYEQLLHVIMHMHAVKQRRAHKVA